MGLGMVIMTQVIGAFKQLTNIIQDFERANSKLASVLGTTIDGVSRLTDQAKYLGRTTTATASQVTGLQTELAKTRIHAGRYRETYPLGSEIREGSRYRPIERGSVRRCCHAYV